MNYIFTKFPKATLAFWGIMLGFIWQHVYAQNLANDSICQAIMLTVDGGCNDTINGDNTGATAEVGEPLPACFSEGPNSVWYSFVAPASGKVTVTTDSEVTGSNTDTEVALYALRGGDCTQFDSLIEVGCSQDISFFGPFLSTISNIDVVPADTYYIQVSGWNGVEGTFCIEVREAVSPVNDLICNATTIEVGAVCDSTNGDNTSSSNEAGEPDPDCFSEGPNSVWYTFTGPPSGFVSVTTDFFIDRTDANTDTEIALYFAPDTSCPNFDELILIACSQDDGVNRPFLSNIFLAPATAGETFYVQVSGWGGAEGAFCLEVHELDSIPAPVGTNDSLCNAIPLVVGDSCTGPNGDNTDALFEIGEPIPACFTGSPMRTVWYSFIAPASGLVNIRTDIGDSTTVSLRNTEIALYTLNEGDCRVPQNLEMLACDNDSGNEPLPNNSAIFADSLIEGATYYVQVSGRDTTGTFCIEVQEAFRPANDSVCNAIGVPVDGQVYLYTNALATSSSAEQLIAPEVGICEALDAWCLDTEIRQSVWFTFIAPSTGAVLVDLCNEREGTEFDTRLAVYDVIKCSEYDSFSLLAANDDLPGCAFASQLPLTCLTPGLTYYILVDGFGTDQGQFGISITETDVPPISSRSRTESPYCTGGDNGFINLIVAGGVAPYSYLWDTGEESEDLVAGPGIHQVIITDACGTSDTLSVDLLDEAPILAVDAGPGQSICWGDTVALGGNPTAQGGLTFVPENAYVADIFNSTFFRHDLNRPNQVQNISQDFAGAYYAGDFGPDAYYILEDDNKQLLKVDTVTGRTAVVGNFASLTDHIWTGLAWDASSNQMYATSSDGAIGTLYSVDHTTGETTPLANLSGVSIPIWLAIDNEGNAYTMDISTDSLYNIDLSNGNTTGIGPIGFNANFAQDADFDPRTNILYLAAMNDDSTGLVSELRIAILTTGQTIAVGPISLGTGQVAALGISKYSFTAPYSYTWSPDEGVMDVEASNTIGQPNSSLYYTVSVMDACGNTAIDSISIFVSNPRLEISNTPDDGIGNGTATVVPSGGVPPYDYVWSSGDSTAMADSLTTGTYFVTVTDILGCSITDSTSLFITNIGDIRSAGLSRLDVFPNPNAGLFNVRLELLNRNDVELLLFDSKGRQLYQKTQKQVQTFETSINLTNLAKGVYILRVNTGLGSAYRRLIVR